MHLIVPISMRFTWDSFAEAEAQNANNQIKIVDSAISLLLILLRPVCQFGR